MRAVAVFPEQHAIRVVDHPEPQLTCAHEVKLQMLEIGVCGTDREIARFEYGTPPPDSPYLVIGHESLGRALEVGPQVRGVQVGDLVVTSVRRPCPHPGCRACRAGRQDFCFTGDFSERGIKQRHGFMAERVVEHERYMHVVPPALVDVAVLVEPLTIAEKALLQVWDVQQRLPWSAPAAQPGAAHGQRALVLGAGPVGLLGALALLVRGFETWVYSNEGPDGDKARWVASVGAHFVSSESATPQQLAAAIGNIDLVYEATGVAQVSFAVLDVLGVNGVFIFTGVPGRKRATRCDGDQLMRKLVLENQLVFGTVNAGPDAFRNAIGDLTKFAARWPAQLRALITGRYPPEAVHELLLGPASGIKRVVRFAEK